MIYLNEKSEFIDVQIIRRKVDGKGLFSIETKARDLSFSIEVNRGLDISNLIYKGVKISYDSPIGVLHQDSFDYSTSSFGNNMFYGLLTTCGLENTGPECGDGNKYYSQHGSINYEKAHNITITFKNDGEVMSVYGEVFSERFNKHKFILKRNIIFDSITNRIVINDKVVNNGEKDQLCLMYHINFGQPFLNKSNIIEIPYIKAIPKNNIAKLGINTLLNVFDANENNLPQVYYLEFDNRERIIATIKNVQLGISVNLSFLSNTLPKMDLWKNLRPDKYVISFEPCNAFPYGRIRQIEQNEAQYINMNEEKEFFVEIEIKGE